MRRLILLLIVCCMVSLATVNAQTKQKGFFVEASVSCAKDHIKNYAIITPTIAYQFNLRWSAGMKVGFETATFPYTIYTPFIRFNFLQVNKLSLFTEAQFNLLSRDVDGGQTGYDEAGLSFGLTYSLVKHLNLVGHYLFVGYSGKNEKEGAWLGNSDFALDASVSRLQLGLQFIF